MDDPNHCKDHFEGVKERVTRRSYLQRIMDYITGNGKIKYIYVYPDISVEQGTSTLDILRYKDESGRAKLDIKLPTGFKFSFPKAQTEIVNLQEDAGFSKFDNKLPTASKFASSSTKNSGPECEDTVKILNDDNNFPHLDSISQFFGVGSFEAREEKEIEKCSSMHMERYRKTVDKEMRKETTERENKTAMLLTPDLSPGLFEKHGNSEVLKFISTRTKIPSKCKIKLSTQSHTLNQDFNLDELIQGIVIPGRDRTEHEPEDEHFGDKLNKIKTVVVNPELELSNSTNDSHTTKKERNKLCKLCQNRELDTIFLPCGHLVCCNFCCKSQSFKLCPQCLNEIERVNEAHF